MRICFANWPLIFIRVIQIIFKRDNMNNISGLDFLFIKTGSIFYSNFLQSRHGIIKDELVRLVFFYQFCLQGSQLL